MVGMDNTGTAEYDRENPLKCGNCGAYPRALDRHRPGPAGRWDAEVFTGTLRSSEALEARKRENAQSVSHQHCRSCDARLSFIYWPRD